MVKGRQKKGKDSIDQMLDTIDFRWLTPDEVVGQDGLIKQISGRILQRALEAEMTEHRGYGKDANAGDNSVNSGNGHPDKTVLLEHQSAAIEVPRDRNGTFEPVIVPQYAKRVPLFNDQIIAMYSIGMSGRDIKRHQEKINTIEVSAEQSSGVTEAVRERQSRPLETSYAIVYLDAVRVNRTKVRAARTEKAVPAVALGVHFEGKKEV